MSTHASAHHHSQHAAHTPKPTPKVRFYRSIVGTFVALNVVLLLFVIYLSLVKATVYITPKDLTAQASFIADIANKPESAKEVPGIVVAQDFEEKSTVQVTGGVEVPGRAQGTVVIKNTSGRAQALVKTTRLHTAEKRQFRIQADVNVPAGGQVEVVALADEEGVDGNLAAGTKLTIPGLSTTLQTQITGEVKAAFTGGMKTVAKVEQKDLDNALGALTATLLEKAKKELAKSNTTGFDGATYTYELLEKKSDTTPGTEAASFTVSARYRVAAAFYDASLLDRMIRAKLMESLSSDLVLGPLAQEDIKISLQKFDTRVGLANVKIEAKGKASLKEGGQVLDKGRIAGLEESQAEQLLKSYAEIADADVVIRPFWIKSVPKLMDHIQFVVEEKK